MGAMRALRWSGGSLLGLLAGILGLVGVVLCVTLILLPLGIPVLYLSRKLFRAAGQMVVPRAARHPVQELGKKGRKKASDLPVPGRTSRTDRVRRALHLA
jgi:hypothetical protein